MLILIDDLDEREAAVVAQLNPCFERWGVAVALFRLPLNGKQRPVRVNTVPHQQELCGVREGRAQIQRESER